MEKSAENKASKRHVSKDAVTASARELAILLDAGVALVRAVRILGDRVSDKALAAVLRDVAERIESGSSFASALAAHPHVFDDLFINMVKVGETGGSLDMSLQRLAAHYERERDLRRRVRNAMTYPLASLVIAAIVVAVIVVGVVPQFTKFYDEQGVDLPWPTRIIDGLGDVIIYGWWIIIPLVFLLWFGFRQYKNSPSGRRQVDAIKLRIPRLRHIYVRILTTRLSATLYTLIQNGIPLVPALRLTGDTVGNVHVGDVCKRAASRVEQGDSVTSALDEANIFPPLFLDMMGVGEEAGSLDQALERVVTVYEEETKLALDSIVTLIQPVLVIIIGLAVILLALAVLMPYFGLQSVILAV